jgi:hypothetical protein
MPEYMVSSIRVYVCCLPRVVGSMTPAVLQSMDGEPNRRRWISIEQLDNTHDGSVSEGKKGRTQASKYLTTPTIHTIHQKRAIPLFHTRNENAMQCNAIAPDRMVQEAKKSI